MKVKNHTYLSGLTQDDPAEYAIGAGLVGVHQEWVFSVIGAWRWNVIAKNRHRIKELVTAGYTIDFGGAAAPIGYGAKVVDYQAPMPGGARSLLDVPGQADCIFTSHTLEHMVDVVAALALIWFKLKQGGHAVIQVPSWNKENLRAASWDYHEVDFCWQWEENAPDHCVRLDTLVTELGFEIELKDETNGNYLVIARKT